MNVWMNKVCMVEQMNVCTYIHNNCFIWLHDSHLKFSLIILIYFYPHMCMDMTFYVTSITIELSKTQNGLRIEMIARRLYVTGFKRKSFVQHFCGFFDHDSRMTSIARWLVLFCLQVLYQSTFLLEKVSFPEE